MPRKKNVDWQLPEANSWESSKLAVLMDIRDELQTLNRILSCPNFIAIPQKLDRIGRNTEKKRTPKQ